MSATTINPGVTYIQQVAADPGGASGAVAVYSKDVGGTARLFTQLSSGAVVQVGAAAAGAVTLATSTANMTNVNLSTEGTIDWCAYTTSSLTGFNLQSDTQNGAGIHRKITGGRLAENFRWVWAGGGGTAGNTTVNADATKFPGRSTTASDSIAQTALASDQTCLSLTGVSGSGYGGIWAIPMRPGETGTLKIYLLVQDHTSTFTTWMASNPGGIQTDSVVGAAGNPGTPVTLTITFTAGTYGDTLYVRCAGSATGGFNPRLYVASATMF